MKPAAALVCLVVLFQTSHGLKCYQCDSGIDTNPPCTKIVNENYLREFGSDFVCYLLVVEKIDDYDHYSNSIEITRKGVPKDEIVNVRKKMEELENAGYEVELKTCTSDGCNNKRPYSSYS